LNALRWLLIGSQNVQDCFCISLAVGKQGFISRRVPLGLYLTYKIKNYYYYYFLLWFLFLFAIHVEMWISKPGQPHGSGTLSECQAKDLSVDLIRCRLVY
jgi:hypothetical protein